MEKYSSADPLLDLGVFDSGESLPNPPGYNRPRPGQMTFFVGLPEKEEARIRSLVEAHQFPAQFFSGTLSCAAYSSYYPTDVDLVVLDRSFDMDKGVYQPRNAVDPSALSEQLRVLASCTKGAPVWVMTNAPTRFYRAETSVERRFPEVRGVDAFALVYREGLQGWLNKIGMYSRGSMKVD